MSSENFIPKEATQQSKFFKKYPEYDGRGIKIAILDMDVVDTSLPGLQTTSIGLPKIIYCSPKGGITVDTSKIVERNGKRFISGLSGSKKCMLFWCNLMNFSNIIPRKWNNPSDQWHLGSTTFKQVYDITIEDDGEDYKRFERDFSENIKKSELWKDKIIDCIVWFDGEKWRACIDTTSLLSTSNLKRAKILSNYEDEHKFAYLIHRSIYCITIAEDGNLLKISYPHCGHATQMAHVAAAYFPDESQQCNGAAPGAQIVSLDYLSQMSVHNALLKCIELEVDIVSISICFQLESYIVETTKKMVEEHGMIITRAATNLGPFYSSIPEQYFQISDEILFIGSVFTQEMKTKFKKRFHFCNKNKPLVYNTSSRGPLLSGARGIDFVAPGAAITDVPKWFSKKNKSSHGTSFAAPNVAGSIACLLSALRANNIPYTPAMIKAALSNTAFLPKGSDRLAFGNGIIQINNAFEFIKKYANFLPTKFLVPSLIKESEKKGILLVQNDNNNNNLYDYCFNLDPVLQRKWILKSTSSDGKVDFVTHDKTVSNSSFNVQIDTSLLKEGTFHYAEIHGYDSLNPSIESLFHFPITVIYPADANYFSDKIITVKPDLPSHFFIKKSSPDFKKCCINIKSFKVIKKAKVKMEFCQTEHQHENWKVNVINVTHYFEFIAKKKTDTVILDFEDNEEYFQLCLSHNAVMDMTFKIKISFQKPIL